MVNTLFSATDLTKTHGKGAAARQALRGVSFDIVAGESQAIVGESGSGKSTLLSLLGLLDRPTSGHLHYQGSDVAGMREREANRLRNQDFGFVFQSFHLDARATVADNIKMPLLIAGASKGSDAKVDQVLARLGLEGRGSSRASDLSGGQKQRVAIARAIINEPAVIFADEPTGALDSETGDSVTDLLFDLNREHNITLVMVTHSSRLAARCDRSIELLDGQITHSGQALTGAHS